MAVFDYIIDQFILKGVNEGLSGNVIQRALQTAGLGVRRADLQARIRELTNVPIKASVLKYIPNGSYASPNTLTQAGSYQSKNYFYRLQLTMKDDETGEITLNYYNISSDEELTIGEAKDIANEKYQKGTSGSNQTIISTVVTSVQSKLI